NQYHHQGFPIDCQRIEIMTNRAGAVLRSFGSRLTRTKHIPKGDLTTNLRRCLNTFDITMIGVGHMIGAGIFVTTGEVMRNLAGPSTTLSYIISGLAALLSALCYAEFGARYPKAGSAYTYAYVGCGEIWAFIIGWNIILEHVLSAAAVGRTFAGYLDDLFNLAVRDWTVEHARPWPWNTVSLPNTSANVSMEICVDAEDASMLSDRSLIGYYPDFISVAVIVFSALFVGLGSKAASNFNSVFSLANLVVIVGVVGYGITFANFENWNNFMPCGINGVLAGASKCFFAYVGFDGLATAGEEAKNPTTTIPRATYYSMAIVTTCYVLMSGTLSLMLPYYQLPTTSVYSAVFIKLGAPHWISLVIAIGALLGILTSLVGSLFCMPRAVFAMAEDGLLFGWWARVNPWTKTPLNATITFTILTALIAMSFDLDALVDFLSIGTILAYSIVAAALIILRYRPHPEEFNPAVMDQGGKIRHNIPFLSERLALMKPGNSILYTLLVMIVAFAGIGLLISTHFFKTPFGIALMIMLSIISIGCVLFLEAHQQNSMDLDYKVFLVPYLPSVSLLINILMITQLTLMTWIRLFVWMAIGFSIYLIYGLRHSKEEINWRQKRRDLAEKNLSGAKDGDNYWRVTDISMVDTPPRQYKDAWSEANSINTKIGGDRLSDGETMSEVRF
ncbi:hypothetical protein PENTCL1PPCAC_5247, partial [Pristionchus entomophagus]